MVTDNKYKRLKSMLTYLTIGISTSVLLSFLVRTNRGENKERVWNELFSNPVEFVKNTIKPKPWSKVIFEDYGPNSEYNYGILTDGNLFYIVQNPFHNLDMAMEKGSVDDIAFGVYITPAWRIYYHNPNAPQEEDKKYEDSLFSLIKKLERNPDSQDSLWNVLLNKYYPDTSNLEEELNKDLIKIVNYKNEKEFEIFLGVDVRYPNSKLGKYVSSFLIDYLEYTTNHVAGSRKLDIFVGGNDNQQRSPFGQSYHFGFDGNKFVIDELEVSGFFGSMSDINMIKPVMTGKDVIPIMCKDVKLYMDYINKHPLKSLASPKINYNTRRKTP